MDILKRDSNSINIASFWEGVSLNKFNFEPPYQRDSVWSEEKQSFFIDSILRNYPIPPIFLHQKINDDTGKISFEVVDGKQRLNSIVSFIQGDISSSSEVDDDDLTGIYFEDLSSDEFKNVKKHFWRYQIPIEYIDTEDEQTIDSIFDRLNRNGEKLNGQELRNAKYHGTSLLNAVDRLVAIPYWSSQLTSVDKKRMEDKELISELFFCCLEDSVFGSNQEAIDNLYEKYAKTPEADLQKSINLFNDSTDYISKLNIEFKTFRASGVSHLYAFFNYSKYCMINRIDNQIASAKLKTFLTDLRDPNFENKDVHNNYTKTMTSNTKSKYQRERRCQILIDLFK